MLDTVMIEVPNPKHPQGVKGVDEVPAAVASAVHNAPFTCITYIRGRKRRTHG
jgi:hypothetical protein